MADFRIDRAADTLRDAVDLLAGQKQALNEGARARLADLFRKYGPLVAAVNQSHRVSDLAAFLSDLWELRGQLPPAFTEVLAAGQGRSGAIVMFVPDPTLQTILARMIEVSDFRVFRDPAKTAGEVQNLIDGHRDRLSDQDRAEWQRLRDAYQQDRKADGFLRGVEQRFSAYPAVQRLLDAGKVFVPPPTIRDAFAFSTTPSPTAGGLIPKEVLLAAAAAPAPLVRFANVFFPDTVLQSQERVPLIVHIAQAAAAGVVSVTEGQAQLSVTAGDLTLAVTAQGFQCLDAIGGQAAFGMPNLRTVQVKSGLDSEPVVFFLKPTAPGQQRISIDFYQSGCRIGTLAFITAVVDQQAITALSNVKYGPTEITSLSPGAKPADLELRVLLSADEKTLVYRLNTAATKEFQFAPLGEVRLGVDPCQYLQGTFDTLSDIAKKAPEDRTPAETERCLQEFIDIGVGLYRDLFSPELKDAYRRLRGRDEYRTLVIISDEPWIPWEMVKPVEFDQNGTLVFRDGHLCETFQLARWVSTGRTTPDKVPVKAGALVLPPANLQNAQVEADYFVKLHQQEWEVVAQPPLASVSDVEASFRDGTKELFHFACHGNFESPTPDTSKLELSDGFLTPGQIVGDEEAGLRRSRPLVFLNACYAGRTGFSLTQIGGWAQRFIDAGVSAFIGSLWEINDRLAARFAVEFYNRLWGLNGQQKLPLGEAFRQARLVIKEADPANPTWLAYVLYGDPLAEVDLGG